MSDKSSIFVSESISDLIDMDQFFDSPGDMENISVEISLGQEKLSCLVDTFKISEDIATLEVTCNCTKATSLVFGPDITCFKFLSKDFMQEINVSIIGKSLSVTASNNYKCKFIAKLL